MSLGFYVHIPAINRLMIPFYADDNNDFLSTLERRIDNAAIAKPPFHKTDVNYFIINSVVSKLIPFLEENYNKKDNELLCLNFAGEICQFVKHAKICEHKNYRDNLKRLKRLMNKMQVDVNHTGLDQVYARLKYLMEFQDPSIVWDFYALWLEDIKGNEKLFSAEETS